MRVVIIEDEFFTSEDLKTILLELDHSIEVVDIIRSVDDALVFFDNNFDIDLIFSDIELEDGLSFEIYSKLQLNIPVIFCTAYNHYALEAFKTFSIDYLLKPFNKDSVASALLKWRKMKRDFAGRLNQSTLKNLESITKKTPGSYLITKGERIIPISTEDIALFYVSNNYVFLLTMDRKEFVIGEKLENLEEQFSPLFFRVNRQFLVNRNAIKDVSQHLSRKLKINMAFHFEQEVLVGKVKATSFLEWLKVN